MLVIFILLIGTIGIWRTQTTALFWRVGVPLFAARSGLENIFSSVGGQFTSKNALLTENGRLKAALASSTAALADRNALYQENTFLKAQFGRNVTLHSILAGVFMRPPSVPYDTLYIDAGSHEGLTKGELVYAGGSTLIGTLSDVYDDTSRVLLISSPGQTYQAFVGNKLPISIEGQGAGSMRGVVPAGSVVVIGDPVSLPSINSNFVGVVSHVDAKSGESFETIYMHLPVNLFELRYVEIRKAAAGTL